MSVFTHCPECGVYFGAPDGFFDNRQKDNRNFWCPNGHVMSYRENMLDKTRRERDAAKQQLARVEQEKIEAIAAANARTKTAERKTKNAVRRANAGTCQCCHRTFSNMQRHMATKHPEICERLPMRKLKVVK